MSNRPDRNAGQFFLTGKIMTTTPNPILKKLGFADTDRLVIIHTDDIGMCQASVSAFSDLADAGLISSGAVMVPCAWALAAAAYCRQHSQVDMGVHTTLTSEWPTYRWGPVSTRQASSGLIDSEGFFYHSSEAAQEHAQAGLARQELAAQVDLAIRWGMRPTHIDTHMGAIAHPKLMQAYIEVGLERGIPPMMLRLSEEQWKQRGMDSLAARSANAMLAKLEEQGIPLVDYLVGMTLDDPADRLEKTKQVLNSLPVGVTHFIIHPSKDTPELRAITTDWACRVADYQVFTSQAMRDFLKTSGLQVIGYRHLQQMLPSHQN
jgi:chitin disaccharide deacetylase